MRLVKMELSSHGNSSVICALLVGHRRNKKITCTVVEEYFSPGFTSSNSWLARRLLTSTCEAERLLRKTANNQIGNIKTTWIRLKVLHLFPESKKISFCTSPKVLMVNKFQSAAAYVQVIKAARYTRTHLSVRACLELKELSCKSTTYSNTFWSLDSETYFYTAL